MSELLDRACGVCGSCGWTEAYAGPIRDGVFGQECSGRVARCFECGVEYLAEPAGLGADAYQDETYRLKVGEAPDARAFFERHDQELLRAVPFLPDVPLRGRRVADVGCGGGSLLDVIGGLAHQTIAIEPAQFYHESLKSRGHLVYEDVATAAGDWAGAVDLVVCLSVIEHVDEPTQLLAGIRRLLAPGGVVVLSTPNRDDLLLAMGIEPYRRFFYRLVHRYYFDAASLGRAAASAGFASCEARFHQRFDFGNFIGWLQHQRPCGRGTSPLGPSFDATWRAALEQAGRSDYIYAYLR